MISIAQQTGLFPAVGQRLSQLTGMDGLVLVDALASIMGHEEKRIMQAWTFGHGTSFRYSNNYYR